MRIRSTKPEFWRSRTIASVDWDARFVLKGLESYVDDNGVGKDDAALIIGDVFSRDMLANPRDTVARVTEAVSQLHQAGLIWRYEVDGVPLLYISNWDALQRVDKPNKGRLPRPDGTMDYKESVIRESVAKPRESVAPGTGEQGNRGTGESLSHLSYSGTDRARENEQSERAMILIPDDWGPNDLHRAKYPRPDLDQLAEGFRDHAVSVGRRCNGRAGWDAAFGNWIRKSPTPATPGVGTATTKAQGWLDLVNNLPPDPGQKAIGQ